jgi:predicted RNase H-related nuclease YkuK (DUF458 family)
MEKVFKELSRRSKIDLIPYVKKYLSENPNVDIYIGCDSQNTGRSTNYATVIVLHKERKGGHVLYTSESVPKIKDRFTRLWSEVEHSIDLAEFLTLNGIKKPKFIDIDLNPDPRFKSNIVLRSALGYVESMGYTPRCKPYAAAASYAADKLCK